MTASTSRHDPCRPARLLTAAELAGLLRVHQRTIARLVRRGELPVPIKIGSRNRWILQEVEQALAAAGRQPGRRVKAEG